MRVKEILRSGEWVAEIAGKTGPNAALARPHGVNLGRSTENCRSLVQRVHAHKRPQRGGALPTCVAGPSADQRTPSVWRALPAGGRAKKPVAVGDPAGKMSWQLSMRSAPTIGFG